MSEDLELASAVEHLKAVAIQRDATYSSPRSGGYADAVMNVYAHLPEKQFYADLRITIHTLSNKTEQAGKCSALALAATTRGMQVERERDTLEERVRVLEGAQQKWKAQLIGYEDDGNTSVDMQGDIYAFINISEVRRIWQDTEAAPTQQAVVSEGAWQPITKDTDATSPIWAALRVSHNGGPHLWEVHLICCDDETGNMIDGYEHGWALDDYERWMPASVPAPPPSSAGEA
jgi:hypothetical protein